MWTPPRHQGRPQINATALRYHNAKKTQTEKGALDLLNYQHSTNSNNSPPPTPHTHNAFPYLLYWMEQGSVIPQWILLNVYFVFCLLFFYILTASNVIAWRVPTCDSEHTWGPYSAALLGKQAPSTITWYPTQSHFPENQTVLALSY